MRLVLRGILTIFLAASLVLSPIYQQKEAKAVVPIALLCWAAVITAGVVEGTAETLIWSYLEGQSEAEVAQNWVNNTSVAVATNIMIYVVPWAAASSKYGERLCRILNYSGNLIDENYALSYALTNYMGNIEDQLSDAYQDNYPTTNRHIYKTNSSNQRVIEILLEDPAVTATINSLMPTEEELAEMAEMPEPELIELTQTAGSLDLSTIPLSGAFSQTYIPTNDETLSIGNTDCDVVFQNRETKEIIDPNLQIHHYGNAITLDFLPYRDIAKGAYDVLLKFDIENEAGVVHTCVRSFSVYASDTPTASTNMPSVVEDAVRDSLQLTAETTITEAHIKQVQRLDLSDLELGSLGAWIGDFTNLKELDLEDNNLTTLPTYLLSLLKLELLDISNNPFDTFPIVACQFPILKRLWAGNIGVTKIPRDIQYLLALERIDLRQNRLNGLPNEMATMPHLVSLDIRECGLRDVPPIVFFMPKLRWLKLSKNYLTETPGDYSRLTTLEYLDIGENRISAIPSCILDLPALHYLDIGGNLMTSLPDNIGNALNLQALIADDLGLEELPSSLWSLSKLEYLKLSENKLDENDFIGKLRNLWSLNNLDIKENRLSKIPGDVVALTRLYNLNFEGNNITCTDCNEDDPILDNQPNLSLGDTYSVYQSEQLVIDLPADGTIYTLLGAPNSVSLVGGNIIIAPESSEPSGFYVVRLSMDTKVYKSIVVSFKLQIGTPLGWLPSIMQLLY